MIEPDCVPHVVYCAATCKVGYHTGHRQENSSYFWVPISLWDSWIYWNQLLCEEDILYCEN